MAFKEINVPLKFPGSASQLSRLGNTVLEGLVYGIYKDVLLGEQEYEVEAVVYIMRGNLVLNFTPQYAGVHTGRIFSDGQEICKPFVFRITLNGQAVREEGARRGSPLRSKGLTGSVSTTFTDDMSEDSSVFTQNTGLLSHARSDTAMLRGRRNDSNVNFLTETGMPVAVEEEGSPMHQRVTSFNDLYSQKYVGAFSEADIQTTRKAVLHASLGPDKMLTTETLTLLQKDVASHMKRRPCEICTKKRRAPRRIDMWGFCFCNSCFKRQYLRHPPIEHFMIPTIEQVKVDIPVDKKFGKRAHFVSVIKYLPQVNLRGLTVDIIRQAQTEFKRFCVTNDGWIDNVFILPMIKSHLTNFDGFSDQQVAFLLTTKSFKSIMESMGLKDRDKVHEVEYLSLLAFVTREKHLLGHSKSSKSEFTTRDLAVVYAVKGLHHTTESEGVLPNLSQRKVSSRGLSISMAPGYEREGPVGAMARNDDIRGSRSNRSSVHEDTRFKRLSDISMQTDQLTRLTKEKGERKEILPIHRKTSTKGGPTAEELMGEMKLTGSSADGWMLY